MTTAVCPYSRRDEQGEKFTPETHPMRAGLPELPERMKHLPVDERGYPVPMFVAYVNRKPEFRAAVKEFGSLCIKNKTCWVCGCKLMGEAVFVIGPMCAINRVSSEPPSHRDCARYSAIACPFLTRPQMVRREGDGMPTEYNGPGESIRRNPGVALLWFSRGHEARRYPEGFLWHFTRTPLIVEWYARGRQATRAEVLESIRSGLPALEAAADRDGSRGMLEAWTRRAMQLVPRR